MNEQRPHRTPATIYTPDALPVESRAAETRPTVSRSPDGGALLGTLSSVGDTLAAIGAALNLSAAQIAAAEANDRFETFAILALDTIAEWNRQQIAEWFTVCGADLQIDLRLTGFDLPTDVPSVSLRAAHAPADTLERFITEALSVAESQGDMLEVETRVALAKTQVCAKARALLAIRPEYLGDPEMIERTKVLVFYTTAACNRLLTPTAIFDWERLGVARADGRAFIVICDARGYLAGLALELLGARMEALPRWLMLSRAGWRQFCERAHVALRLRDEETQWAGAPQALTPAHLRVESRASGLEGSATLLMESRAALAATYLASSIHSEADGTLALRFAGARPASWRLGENSERKDLDDQRFAKAALAHLAAWAYDHGSPDKLVIARESLARELPPGAIVTLPALEQAAAGAMEAAKANFSIYLRGATERYFQLRQDALDTVSAYAATVRTAVSDLTSDVVENVYRTAGLLVGVVIAGVLDPSLSLPIERLAVVLYTAYVAFVLCFVLRARERRYHLEARDLDQRLAAMSELSATERATLRRQPAAEQAYFQTYFRWTQRIYLALIVLGVLYFILLLTPVAAHVALPHR